MGVVVVGGGWSGIAAAVELVSRGVSVTLIESAREPGGRARRVTLGGLCVDNGPHLLLGAYHDTLELIKRLDVDEAAAFLRQPLELRVEWADGSAFHLRSPRLPAPLNLFWGLLGCIGLTLAERLQALRLGLSLRRTGLPVSPDMSVTAWLSAHGQPERVREALWEPLCLAALNTAPAEASAQVFLRVLRDAFTRHARDSDLILPCGDLSRLLPAPGLAYIEAHGGQVHLGQRVTGLTLRGRHISGVETRRGAVAGDQVILAVPPGASRRLLASHPPLIPLAARIEALDHRPICSVYLQYPAQVSLGRSMLGLVGRTAQWVFDRGLNGQPGLMAVVISGDGPHMALDNETLSINVGKELAHMFPHWPAPLERRVIREKRATFASRVGVEDQRPDHIIFVHGLWLAGDYTATGYPATLEGAVRSGLQCARLALESSSI